MRKDEESLEEQEILEAAVHGDHTAVEALLNRYKPLVRARARAYRLAGADHEDLVQEGMIGLFKAIRDYRATTGTPFAGFADLCVTRQVLTAVKTAARKKHLPLNTYLSLNWSSQDGDEEGGIPDLRESEAREPERHFIRREEVRRIASAMDSGLSPFERQVIGLYMVGENYQSIARLMQRPPKSIDNALQRIRHKVGVQLQRQMDEDDRG